ncbi:MAG: FAD-dependent oxidoreductase [Parvularculaceae bacterium]|nr:FAD-dependent oxidoreductase [Parvularculaceae bacterium]
MDDARRHSESQDANSRALPKIAVLGGGPAGLGAAWKLAKHSKAQVELFEAGERLGGNAGSFDADGVRCDFGSHRLHPASDPEILADIKSLLGDDLLLRPRHGRIRLKGSWIHFPLKPVDLATRMPPLVSASLFFDAATAKMRAPRVEVETFGSVMLSGLGRSMCDWFYFPYMKKLWGLDPDELAPTLAKRRVSGSSLPKLIRKIFASLPGLKSPETGKFYYPRNGFGAICDKIGEAAANAGATLSLNSRVEGIEISDGRIKAIKTRSGESVATHQVDAVWSTLPLTVLARAAGEGAPEHVRRAAASIRYRGMILVYIVLDTDQYTEFDAHYFPELSIPISRLSEPKNYSAATQPDGRTILCAELPSDPGDQYWAMSDEALGEALYRWLGECGLPQSAKVTRAFTRRLPFAYPVYDRDYEAHFDTLDKWVSGIDGLLTFGRQGLFAHDNTHHALAMAYGAVDCLEPGGFNLKKWADYRREFLTHVVED